MQDLTISGLARAADVGVETVRYYQRRGLLAEPSRFAGRGIRRYGKEDVRRLRFIRAAKVAGFTLEEAGTLLRLDPKQDRARIRELSKARIAALDTEITEKQKARDALNRLARLCATSKGPCPIIGALDRR